MFRHRQSLSSIPHRCTKIRVSKSFSSISRVSFPARVKGEQKEREDGGWSAPKDPTMTDWKKTIGKRFEKPHRPCNWLGDKVPFPLNPSFKPPTPVSDALKNTLYQSFMANPTANSARELASRYYLSIKRVESILRLKGLEESWKKGKPLQTGFLKGMEQILGVRHDAREHKTHEDWVQSRMKTVEADALDQVEGDQARARYQRMFWEPVVEGQEPVLPTALKKAREDAKRHGRSDEHAKSNTITLDLPHEGGRQVTNTSGAAIGRPAIKFIDVGDKFVDPKDRMRRMKESERRAKVRSKKASKRHLVPA